MRQTISKPKVIEGNWNEVKALAEPYANHRVRLTILPLDKTTGSEPNIPVKIPGLVIATMGSGSFEDVMALMSDSESISDEESLIEPILQNRAMRRSSTSKRECE